MFREKTSTSTITFSSNSLYPPPPLHNKANYHQHGHCHQPSIISPRPKSSFSQSQASANDNPSSTKYREFEPQESGTTKDPYVLGVTPRTDGGQTEVRRSLVDYDYRVDKSKTEHILTRQRKGHPNDRFDSESFTGNTEWTLQQPSRRTAKGLLVAGTEFDETLSSRREHRRIPRLHSKQAGGGGCKCRGVRTGNLTRLLL